MRLKEAGVFKILGEMAKWANNSEDKQIQSITDESVTGLDVFLSPCVLQEECKMKQVCFTAVLVIPTFGHWTLPRYFALNALKQHLICPFLPGG